MSPRRSGVEVSSYAVSSPLAVKSRDSPCKRIESAETVTTGTGKLVAVVKTRSLNLNQTDPGDPHRPYPTLLQHQHQSLDEILIAAHVDCALDAARVASARGSSVGAASTHGAVAVVVTVFVHPAPKAAPAAIEATVSVQTVGIILLAFMFCSPFRHLQRAVMQYLVYI